VSGLSGGGETFPYKKKNMRVVAYVVYTVSPSYFSILSALAVDKAGGPVQQ